MKEGLETKHAEEEQEQKQKNPKNKKKPTEKVKVMVKQGSHGECMIILIIKMRLILMQHFGQIDNMLLNLLR